MKSAFILILLANIVSTFVFIESVHANVCADYYNEKTLDIKKELWKKRLFQLPSRDLVAAVVGDSILKKPLQDSLMFLYFNGYPIGASSSPHFQLPPDFGRDTKLPPPTVKIELDKDNQVRFKLTYPDNITGPYPNPSGEGLWPSDHPVLVLAAHLALARIYKIVDPRVVGENEKEQSLFAHHLVSPAEFDKILIDEFSKSTEGAGKSILHYEVTRVHPKIYNYLAEDPFNTASTLAWQFASPFQANLRIVYTLQPEARAGRIPVSYRLDFEHIKSSLEGGYKRSVTINLPRKLNDGTTVFVETTISSMDQVYYDGPPPAIANTLTREFNSFRGGKDNYFLRAIRRIVSSHSSN